ncbi:PqqD family protein [Flavobacterium commune]|uniref:PqqD family protein n=1 Tax=Flavobacterium commune TaxID=1306519 RepID=UPI0018DD5CB3|nr:PqqD family protein [Flavobacterium commune]
MFTPLEEEGVLYAIEENKYISLNTTYTSIIQYVTDGLDFNTIVAKLMEEYEVDQEVCKVQLNSVISDLIAKDYINEATV